MTTTWTNEEQLAGQTTMLWSGLKSDGATATWDEADLTWGGKIKTTWTNETIS